MTSEKRRVPIPDVDLRLLEGQYRAGWHIGTSAPRSRIGRGSLAIRPDRGSGLTSLTDDEWIEAVEW